MSISISPVAIGLVIIVVSNFFLSFGKSKLMKKSYIIVSSILSIVGILGIIRTRPLLISSLHKNLNKGRLDADFISWAIEKFDYFAFTSIIATCLAIIFLSCLVLANKKNKGGIVWSSFSGFVIVLKVINFLVGTWYCIGTINKFFDLAYYIVILSISEIFALYIPLIVKRLIIVKSDIMSQTL